MRRRGPRGQVFVLELALVVWQINDSRPARLTNRSESGVRVSSQQVCQNLSDSVLIVSFKKERLLFVEDFCSHGRPVNTL